MVRVIVSGAKGRVGNTMLTLLGTQPDIEVVGGFDQDSLDQLPRLLGNADVLVDFTTAGASPQILMQAALLRVRPVSGTTGMSAEALDTLDTALQEQGIGGVWCPNFAIGAVLMMHFAQIAARYMPAAEVIELHHDKKIDAPSGTAVSTAKMIREAHGSALPDPAVEKWVLPEARGAVEGGIRIHSMRLPGANAHQEVVFGALGQLLTIRHDALSREAYVPGVALAVREVMGRVGLVRGLDRLLGLV